MCSAQNVPNCSEHNPNANTCKTCGIGYYENGGTCSAQNKEGCNTYTSNTNTCTSCNAGYKVASGSCTICAAGTYSNTSGATTCSACSGNTYNTSDGSTGCSNTCTGSNVVNNTHTGCTACTGANVANSAHTACTACTGNTVANSSHTGCTSCSGNYTANSAHTACVCKTGYTGTNCASCASGYFMIDGVCRTCAYGSYVASVKKCVWKSSGTMNWDAATTACSNKGYTLPTKDYLKDTLYPIRSTLGISEGYYWSSTVYGYYVATVNFRNGGESATGKLGDAPVLCTGDYK